MFRDLIAEMDTAVFDSLGDQALIDGLPAQGMFAAPWLQPMIGKLNTGLREPHFVVRDEQAHGVIKNSRVSVAGQGEYSVVNLEPDGSGLTVLVLRGIYD
jgi:hypothetical protein